LDRRTVPGATLAVQLALAEARAVEDRGVGARWRRRPAATPLKTVLFVGLRCVEPGPEVHISSTIRIQHLPPPSFLITCEMWATWVVLVP
jgi:hypothetical protein